MTLPTKPENFINRELSWIEFNKRVLEKARNKDVPFFERAKFLSISATNLDEFITVRVGSLKDMEHAGYKKKDISGMDPTEQLDAIRTRLEEFFKKQYSTYKRSLLPKLKAARIAEFVTPSDLTMDEIKNMDYYFVHVMYPLLTPMAVDFSRPFPCIKSNVIHMAALLKDPRKSEGKKKYDLAIIEIPTNILPRMINVATDEPQQGSMLDCTRIVLAEDILEMYLDQIFAPNEIVTSGTFKIIRNGDLPSNVDEAEDLLKEIENKLKKRKWGEVIHLQYSSKMDKRLLNRLKKELKVKSKDIYRIKGPIDLSFMDQLKDFYVTGLNTKYSVTYEPRKSTTSFVIPKDETIFDLIKRRDVAQYHPFNDFESSVVRFIEEAANDPDVVSIKQTLYRVSKDSAVVKALMTAAENGKHVTVLVELMARFDEASNIIWAKRLENAGAHVIYGYKKIKTHAKLCLVIRKENGDYRYYTHIGTGNYNEVSAKIYTDFSLLTANQEIGDNVGKVFNMLTGFSETPESEDLLVAPDTLKKQIIKLIWNETDKTKDPETDYTGRIIMKCNSLSDKDIIQALYGASCAGVKVDLIVRGICCLRPRVYGLSENITVRSIVGRYLEHARIYSFGTGEDQVIYIGSADLMPRNLDYRVEVLVKLLDKNAKDFANIILNTQLNDNFNSKVMLPDGSYKKVQKRGNKVDSQDLELTDTDE